jgi:hypothetical protein
MLTGKTFRHRRAIRCARLFTFLLSTRLPCGVPQGPEPAKIDRLAQIAIGSLSRRVDDRIRVPLSRDDDHGQTERRSLRALNSSRPSMVGMTTSVITSSGEPS